jgi:glycosyltransferase involved in cell wall biosynthesis
MKIVQTNKAYYPLIGGVETIIANFAEGLSERSGINVEVLVCNHEHSIWKQQKTINGVGVTYVPMWTKIASLPISPLFPYHLATLEGDILHVHEPFPLVDLTNFLTPSILRRFSRIVVSWHSDIVRQKWVLSLYSSIIHRFLEKVDSIIVATPNHIESSQFLPSYKDKCVVIPYGLQLDWVNDREKRSDHIKSIQNKFGGPLLLSVGRLVYYKGFKYLVDAVQMLPDVKLVIIGSGPLFPDLQIQINNLGLEKRVTILPHLSDSELYAFYDACDVFILPSTEVSEAFGLVQVEAMACGKPVVSTRLGTGVTFVNQHGVTGLTVNPRDPKAMAEALGQLIDNPDLRLSFGRNAKGRALQEFTAEKMIDRTLTLYKHLLSL